MHHRPCGDRAAALKPDRYDLRRIAPHADRHKIKIRGNMEFRPIELEMKELVERYTKPWHLQCSEYTFTNLYIWGKEAHLELAEEDGALFFFARYGQGKPFMFAPLSQDPSADYGTVLKKAVKEFEKRGEVPCFRAISGPIYEAFKRAEGYSLEEDRDNADYVYSAESLCTLAGKKLHAKRNHINKFRAEYGDSFEYVPVTKDMLEECLAVYDEWILGKDPTEPGALGERCAIERAISAMDVLRIKGGGIRIGGKLAAFTLGEEIDNEIAVIHIEKADSSVPGLYTIINQQFAQREFSHMQYINREEDMGIAGLRKAKLSYYPAFLIEKYRGYCL